MAYTKPEIAHVATAQHAIQATSKLSPNSDASNGTNKPPSTTSAYEADE